MNEGLPNILTSTGLCLISHTCVFVVGVSSSNDLHGRGLKKIYYYACMYLLIGKGQNAQKDHIEVKKE